MAHVHRGKMAAGQEKERGVTNREALIEGLKTKDERLAAYLMCPYLPGEKGAECKDPEVAEFNKDCKPCIQRWLDQEM